MQGCPRVIKTSLQRIIFCGISKYNWGNITQEKYLCNVNPKHTNIVLQVSNLCTVVLNLPGPTLYKAITCAVLADSSQSSQCWLDTSDKAFCGTVTCAILAKSTQSSFHRKITYTAMLSWSAWANIAQEITCAMLTHSTQTTLHKKMMYNFGWICLSQCCTRKLLVQCLPIWLTDNVYEDNNLYNSESTFLRQHCTKKLLVQYWFRAHRHVFTWKPVLVLNDW